MTDTAVEPVIHVSPQAVLLGVDAASAEDAIRAAGMPMVAAGWVTDDYVDAVVAREARFPTGLPTLPEAIAVPHADPDGVLTPSIAVARLRRPVGFVEMATIDRRLPVRLVLLLALQSKDQAAVLSKLIRGLQEAATLGFFLASPSPAAIAERLVLLLSERESDA